MPHSIRTSRKFEDYEDSRTASAKTDSKMLLSILTFTYLAAPPQDEPLIRPLRVADRLESDEWVETAEGVAFWFDPGDGEPVALIPAQPLIDRFQPADLALLDDDVGLWPDPFTFDTSRFGLFAGEVELDGPAWSAWDWTFTLACRAPSGFAPKAAVLTPSAQELQRDTPLSLAYLDESGEVRTSQLQIAELPRPEEERYWLSVRPADASELPATARTLGAPVFDQNGGVAGVVGRRDGDLLQAQPIGEFLTTVPYWRGLWHHELGSAMSNFGLSEDGSRLLLVGQAVELVQMDGMRLLARIEPQDLVEQLGGGTLPPDSLSAAITPGGESIYLHWSEHLHAVPLDSLAHGEFQLELGPQLLSPGLQDAFSGSVQVEALSDGTMLLWQTYGRPARVGPHGAVRLPGEWDAQIAYLPDWGQLLDGRQTQILRYELPSGITLPDVLLSEPVDIEFAALSPRGRRLAISDSFEGWIDVVSLNDGAEPVAPDLTILPHHGYLRGIAFAGEDRLITYGGDYFESGEAPVGDDSQTGWQDSWIPADGALSLLDARTGEELGRSGEFSGSIARVRQLPTGKFLALSDTGELACFDPDELRGRN